MAIGTGLIKAQIDADVAAAALTAVKLLRMLDQLHEFFLITPDASLTAAGVGYTQAEVNTMKAAFNADGPLIASIFRGQATLGAAQDFRANLFQMCGDCVD